MSRSAWILLVGAFSLCAGTLDLITPGGTLLFPALNLFFGGFLLGAVISLRVLAVNS